MVETHRYKGTKKWVYSKEDDERIAGEDTDSTREFKKGYKEWLGKKQKTHHFQRFVRPKRVVTEKPHNKAHLEVPEKYKREVVGKRPEEEKHKKPVKKKPKTWIILFILLVIVSAFLMKDYFLKPANCEDGTLHNSCSSKRPFFCNNGELVKSLEACGCSDGERIYENKCIEIIECIDGSLHPECSEDKPYQCLEGTLILSAQQCGCPEGYAVKGNYCKKGAIKEIPEEPPMYKVDENASGKSLNATIEKIKTRINDIKTKFFPRVKEAGTDLKEIVTNKVDEIKMEITASEKENCQRAFEVVKELRREKGIYQIWWSDELYDIALLRAKDMYGRDYFSHYTPEGYDVGYYLGTPWGYSENIGQGYYTCSGAVEGWIDSPGHYRNLLFGAYGAIASYSDIYVYISVS